MTIKLWHSYSCNNSSAYRLVARFADAAVAREVRDELAAFFAAHALEVDARDGYRSEPSDVQRALAVRYGFTWEKVIIWGEESLEGDEPDVILHGERLVVFHGYCGGGLGDGMTALLAARGATVSTTRSADLEVSVLFLANPGVHAALDEELATMFAAFDEQDDDPEDPAAPWVEPVPVPWKTSRDSYGHVAVFRDAHVVGLHVAIDPRDLELVAPYLESRGIEKYAIAIDEPDDGRLFRAIRRARCRSCDGVLEYLDPRLHDIEVAQLACRPCGGFYDLSAFMVR
jgi:hypothetical protein